MTSFLICLGSWGLWVLASFTFDLTGLLSYAEDLFNNLIPAFVPMLGIVFGVGLVLLVVKVIRGALSGM